MHEALCGTGLIWKNGRRLAVQFVAVSHLVNLSIKSIGVSFFSNLISILKQNLKLVKFQDFPRKIIQHGPKWR